MSLETTNNKLFKYEDNDVADLTFLHNTMDIIDKSISPFFVATLESTNVYKVTTGLNKTELENGFSVKVAIPSNSTGAVKIKIDNIDAVNVISGGKTMTKFKANEVYNLTYYNSVFTCASGSVDDVSFTSDKLLTGYSANNSDGEKVNGTMANNGAVTSTLTAGTSYTIPAGYHNGSGKITANNLASQTNATATAPQILSGQTAYVNGNKITGSMPNMPFQTNAVSVGSNGMNKYFRIPRGAYVNVDSNGVSEIVASATQIDSNIVASNIISGKSICGVNGTATVQSMGGLQLWSTNITTVPFVQDGFNGYYFAKHKVTLPFMPKQIVLKVNTTKTTKYFSYLTSIYNLGTINNTLNLTNYNSSSGITRISAYMSGLDLNIEVGNNGGAVGTIALIELIVIG